MPLYYTSRLVLSILYLSSHNSPAWWQHNVVILWLYHDLVIFYCFSTSFAAPVWRIVTGKTRASPCVTTAGFAPLVGAYVTVHSADVRPAAGLQEYSYTWPGRAVTVTLHRFLPGKRSGKLCGVLAIWHFFLSFIYQSDIFFFLFCLLSSCSILLRDSAVFFLLL